MQTMNSVSQRSGVYQASSTQKRPVAERDTSPILNSYGQVTLRPKASEGIENFKTQQSIKQRAKSNFRTQRGKGVPVIPRKSIRQISNDGNGQSNMIGSVTTKLASRKKLKAILQIGEDNYTTQAAVTVSGQHSIEARGALAQNMARAQQIDALVSSMAPQATTNPLVGGDHGNFSQKQSIKQLSEYARKNRTNTQHTKIIHPMNNLETSYVSNNFSQESPLKINSKTTLQPLDQSGPAQFIPNDSERQKGDQQEMHIYETALDAAIKQDQQVLESIQKNWREVNKRMNQRANLLQTLQQKPENSNREMTSQQHATIQHESLNQIMPQKSLAGTEQRLMSIDSESQLQAVMMSMEGGDDNKFKKNPPHVESASASRSAYTSQQVNIGEVSNIVDPAKNEEIHTTLNTIQQHSDIADQNKRINFYSNQRESNDEHPPTFRYQQSEQQMPSQFNSLSPLRNHEEMTQNNQVKNRNFITNQQNSHQQASAYGLQNMPVINKQKQTLQPEILDNRQLNMGSLNSNIVSPDPKTQFRNDIRQVAQLYRQGQIKQINKYDQSTKDSISGRMAHSKGARQSQSRERGMVPAPYQKNVGPRKSTIDPQQRIQGQHNNLQNNNQKANQIITNSTTRRLAQGSRPQGRQNEASISQNTLRPQFQDVDTQPPNTVNVTGNRKAISKSTMRSNLQTLNSHSKNAPNSNGTRKFQNTQSVTRERGNGSNSRTRHAANVRVGQGSLVVNKMNRIQMKKNMQQATYQSQVNHQTIDLNNNHHLMQSQNEMDGQIQTIASYSCISENSGGKNKKKHAQPPMSMMPQAGIPTGRYPSRMKEKNRGGPGENNIYLGQSTQQDNHPMILNVHVGRQNNSVIKGRGAATGEGTQSPVFDRIQNKQKGQTSTGINNLYSSAANKQGHRTLQSKQMMKKKQGKVQAVEMKKFYQSSASRAESVPPVMKNINEVNNINKVQSNLIQSVASGHQYGSVSQSRLVGQNQVYRQTHKIARNGLSSQGLSDFGGTDIVQMATGSNNQDIRNIDQSPIARAEMPQKQPFQNPGNDSKILSNQFSFKSINQDKKPQEVFTLSNNTTTLNNLGSHGKQRIENNGSDPVNFGSLNQQAIQAKIQYFQSCDHQNLLQVLQKQMQNSINPDNKNHLQDNRFATSLEELMINLGQEKQIPEKTTEILSQLGRNAGYPPLDFKDKNAQNLNISDNNGQNGEEKVLISQIIENVKNPNCMSINEALFYQRDDLGEKRQQHDETIMSSNLVMNHRDRQNIKEFLSAHYSGLGIEGNLPSNSVQADADLLKKLRPVEARESENINIISHIFDASQVGDNLIDEQAYQKAPNLNASHLKNTSANPLLNDSINRSQLSGPRVHENIENANLKQYVAKLTQKPIAEQQTAPKRPQSNTRNRYQVDDEKHEIVRQNQQPDNSTLTYSTGDIMVQERDLQAANNSLIIHNKFLVDKNNSIHDIEEEEEEIIGDILTLDHDKTNTNILITQENSLNYGYKSVNKPNIYVYNAFNADDEDEEMAPNAAEEEEVPENEVDESPSKQELKKVDQLPLAEERPQFIRKRVRQAKFSQGVNKTATTSQEGREQSQDPEDQGAKNVLSQNSTAIGLQMTKTDNLDNSKTSASTLNTINPNRKSTFLFGSRQGNIFAQNNLRYSQQTSGAADGNLQKLQMKSVALAKINQIGLATRPKFAADGGPPESETKYPYEQQSSEANEKNQHISITDEKVKNLDNYAIGEEQVENSEKFSSDPDKITDKITEKYGEEQSQSQSRSENIINEVSDAPSNRTPSLLSKPKAQANQEEQKYIKQIDPKDIDFHQKLELIQSINSFRQSVKHSKVLVSSRHQAAQKSRQSNTLIVHETNTKAQVNDSMDNIMLESMHSQSSIIKAPVTEHNNEYIKQFENNFVDGASQSKQDELEQSSQKNNLIMSQDSGQFNCLEDSTGFLDRTKLQEEVNPNDSSFIPEKDVSKYDIQPFHNDEFQTGVKLPRLRFGGNEDDSAREGITQSKKSTPVHSDDEVTPRRGLDEMMSESKLMGLIESQTMSCSNKNLVMIRQSRGSVAPRTDKIIKTSKIQIMEGTQSSFGNDRDVETSIVIKPTLKNQPRGIQNLSQVQSSRLLQNTGNLNSNRRAEGDIMSRASSNCNMLETDRTGNQNAEQNPSTGRKNRYEDSEPSQRESNRNMDDLQSIDAFEEQIEIEKFKF